MIWKHISEKGFPKMDDNAFIVSAQFSAASTLADRGMSLRFKTPELDLAEQVTIMNQSHNLGWLMFKTNKIQDSEVPKTDAPSGEKTPSQRLRGVIYRYYTQLNKKTDFEVFYRNQMNKIIDKYKQVLD